MKVTTPGSLIGWTHLSARGWRRPNRKTEQARLTDRVDPSVSEREATTELDKQREGGNGQIGQAEQAGLTDSVDPPVSEREVTAKLDKRSRPGGREEVGRGWARKEERMPGRNYFLG
jgi:hypothetical protein